jgi:hypothetical protein
MKTFLTVAALTAVATFALAACGKKADSPAENAAKADAGVVPSTTTNTAPTPDPVLPAEPSTVPSGTSLPAPPPPTLPGDPQDTTPDTMGPPPKA